MRSLLAKNWAELAGLIGYVLIVLGIVWGVKTQSENTIALYLIRAGFIIFVIGMFFGWRKLFAEQRQREMPPETRRTEEILHNG